jgi:Toastrack DUF4097
MATKHTLKLKRAAVASAVLSAIVGGAAAVHAVAFDPYDEPDGSTPRLKHEQAFSSGSTLRISNPNGYIVVRSWDRDYLVVKAVKHLESGASPLSWLTGTDPDAKRRGTDLFDDIRLNVRATDTGVSVQTHLPAELPEHAVRVQYDVMVPRHTNLDLETDNGHITVMDVNGDVRTCSGNGKVSLSNVYGAARVRTSNGNVQCRRVSGKITVRAENGSIELVHHDRVPLTQIDCTTQNGTINLELGDMSEFQLDARTDNGRVTTNFLDAPDAFRARPGRVHGELGTGGPSIRLVTASGGIRIANG